MSRADSAPRLQRMCSPANGITLDTGVTREMGSNVIETIQWFGRRDQINHVQIGKARTDLGRALAKAYHGRLFADNYLWSGLGLVLCIFLQFGSFAIIDDAHQFPTQREHP